MSLSVAAIGGGHGLAATLRALRLIAGEVTAIVSVADDGGSSGRLRVDLGVAPPGDLRKALVALADPSAPLTAAMGERYEAGDLAGHAFGNLLIATLAGVEGDLVRALAVAADLLGAAGAVLPAAVEPVVLRATTVDGATVDGQVAVMGTARLDLVETLPVNANVPKEAIDAVATGDVVVLGPGSLFTSVLAAAVTGGLLDALGRRMGPLVYVCNLHPQDPETSGFDVADHVAALARHGIQPDVVLYDPATIDGSGVGPVGVGVPLAKPNGMAHDASLLASALRSLPLWPSSAHT